MLPDPCERYAHAPLIGKNEGSIGLMVLRVKPTPTRFPINRLYTAMDNSSLFSTLYASSKFSNQNSLSNAGHEILELPPTCSNAK